MEHTARPRAVFCEDALPWLEQRPRLANCSFITSLPDVSGLGQQETPAGDGGALEAWQRWFVRAATLTLAATAEDGVTIFYQTDIKRAGVWVDKSQLCHQAARDHGAELLWHRIVCRKPAGQAYFGRPAYSHLLCYSRGVRDRASPPYPDVLQSTGEMPWVQAMGVAACELACRYVLSHTATRTIVDPFCGWGTVLAVANELGLDAIGIELSRKRAHRARQLRLGRATDNATAGAVAPRDATAEDRAAEDRAAEDRAD